MSLGSRDETYQERQIREAMSDLAHLKEAYMSTDEVDVEELAQKVNDLVQKHNMLVNLLIRKGIIKK